MILQSEFKSFLFSACLMLLTLAPGRVDLSTVNVEANCPPPVNVVKTSQGPGTVSYGWNGNGGLVEYEVWYLRTNDGFVSIPKIVHEPSTDFNNLSPGVYQVFFKTNCQNGTSSELVIDDLIME